MFWGKRDTSILFIEPKYKTLFWIYEFYNTMSSSFYFLTLIPLIKKRNRKGLSCAVAGIGLGSILLHGTGRCYGQWMDEFSILTFVQLILEDLDEKHPKYLRYLLLTYFIFWKKFYYFFGILTMYNIRLFYLMRKEKDFLFISSISTFIWILEQQKFIHLKKYNMHPYWHLGTSIAMYKLIKTVK